MASGSIVVVGSAHMDLLARAERFPTAGETLAGRAFMTRPGGKGVNQALAAAHLRAGVAFVGCHGVDHFGQEVRAALERDGVNTHHMRSTSAAPTGIGSVMMDVVGEYIALIVSGANLSLTAQDVMQAADCCCFDAGCVTLLQWEVPLEASAAAAAVTRDRRGTVIWNAAPAPLSWPRELVKNVDILVVSAGEARQLTGLTDLVAAATSLADLVPTVVVTCGADGVVFVDDARRATIYAAPAVTAVDALGAGDIFVGTLAHALSTEAPLDRSIRFATATASLAVSRGGGVAGMPALQEIMGLLT